MSTPWLRRFEQEVLEEMQTSQQTLLGGFCEDYGRYLKEVGRLEAFTFALEIAQRLDEEFRTGGPPRAVDSTPSDDREI
jgi:hypothetical protein